jgi:hypothetical protein
MLSNGRLMSPAPRALVVLLLTAGCLQPGSTPEGTRVVPGRDVGTIGFLSKDNTPWGITYSQRIAPAMPNKGAVSDIWVAPLPEEFTSTLPGYQKPVDLPVTQPVRIASNRSDTWGVGGASNSVFLMVDERVVASGGAGNGQQEHVATLQRLSTSTYQSDLRFEDISTYQVFNENRILFRRVSADQTPGMYLWDGAKERRLGDVANPGDLDVRFGGSGKAYFILGSERVLSRLGALNEPAEDVYVGVLRYMLRGDERFAIMVANKAGKTVTFALDLTTGKETPFARPNPCCWLGWDGDNFRYSQSAGVNTPAEYHEVDVTTGVETCLTLPSSLSDLADFKPRGGGSDEVLYLDSQGHGVFFGPDQQPRRTVLKPGTDLPASMLSPKFSPDGKYLLYVDPQLPTDMDPYSHGPLLIQPADLSEPPRALTTPGMSVQENSYFFISGPADPIQGPNGPLTAPNEPVLVFWAYVTRSATDLFFANHVTGDLKVVTGAIGNVIVDSQRVFGTVHMSAQDVVGDLTVWNVPTHKGRVISHAVPQYEFASEPSTFGLVGYLVRGRTDSDRDGIWVTTMRDPHDPQDGGQ